MWRPEIVTITRLLLSSPRPSAAATAPPADSRIVHKNVPRQPGPRGRLGALAPRVLAHVRRSTEVPLRRPHATVFDGGSGSNSGAARLAEASARPGSPANAGAGPTAVPGVA